MICLFAGLGGAARAGLQPVHRAGRDERQVQVYPEGGGEAQDGAVHPARARGRRDDRAQVPAVTIFSPV